MQGIRVIRFGVLLGVVLTAVASTGCCECCQHLWKSEKAVPASPPPEIKADDGSGRGRFPQQEQSTHLAPERVHGGIY
jgi:hypothetical protein